MFVLQSRYSIWIKAISLAVVCLFSANSISFAEPSKLAPELRLKPFIDEHLPEFQDGTTLIYTIGKLKGLIKEGDIRDAEIARLNNDLNKRLHGGTIKIGGDITRGALNSGKEYAVAAFNFRKEGKSIKALFLKDYAGSASLTAGDREELKKFGIKNDTDISHLDCPGLEGVWLINDELFLDIDDFGVATIQVNRPEKANALTCDIAARITEFLNKVKDDPDVKMVILRSNEKGFIAGGDLRELLDQMGTLDNPKAFPAMYRLERESILAMHEVAAKIPVVTLVDGVGLGWGLALGFAGGFVAVTDRAWLATPQTTIGHFLNVGESHYVRSRISRSRGVSPEVATARAKYIGLVGELMPADMVKSLGLADTLIRAEQLEDLDLELRELARGSSATGEGLKEEVTGFLGRYDAKEAKDPPELEWIEEFFGQESFDEIMEGLEMASEESDEKGQFALETLQALRQRSPISLRVTNELINQFDPNATPEQIHARDERLLRRFMGHPDPYEGLAAFLDKRAPKFKAGSRMADWLSLREIGVEPEELAPYREIDGLLSQPENVALAAELDRTDNMELILPLLRELAKNKGLLGTGFPVAVGGRGKGAIAEALMNLAVGKNNPALALIVDVLTTLNTWPLLVYGSRDQKEKYLKLLLKGELIFAFALTEQHAGSDNRGMTTSAYLDKSDPGNPAWVLNGEKMWITNAASADYAILYAKIVDKEGEIPSYGDKYFSAFIVPLKGMGGVNVKHIENNSGYRGTGTAMIMLNNARISEKNMLGKRGQGREIFLNSLSGGRISISAIHLGYLERGIEEAMKADPDADITALAADWLANRLLLVDAARRKEAGEDFALEAAMVKLQSAEDAVKGIVGAMKIVGPSCLEGGHILERMFRDVRLSTIGEGTSEIMRARVIGPLIAMRLEGEDRRRPLEQAVGAYLPENVHPDLRGPIGKFAALAAEARRERNTYKLGVLEHRIIDLVVRGRSLQLMKQAVDAGDEGDADSFLRHVYDTALSNALESSEIPDEAALSPVDPAPQPDWADPLVRSGIASIFMRYDPSPTGYLGMFEEAGWFDEEMLSDMELSINDILIMIAEEAGKDLIDKAEEWAKGREAFKEKIIEFPQVQELLNEARGLLYNLRKSPHPALDLLTIADRAIQVHGGAGFSNETGLTPIRNLAVRLHIKYGNTAIPPKPEQKDPLKSAEEIHAKNLDCAPDIPEKTILCHIITDSILPLEQRNRLQVALEQNMEKEMRGGEDYREGFSFLSGANAGNADKYIEDLRSLIQKKTEDYRALGYTDIRFDAACPDTDLVNAILEKEIGIKGALAFEPCKTGFNLAQVEGIMLALRELYSGDIERLKRAFAFLAGHELSAEESAITDIDEFIRTVPFILPPAHIEDHNKRRELNDLIAAKIKQAA